MAPKRTTSAPDGALVSWYDDEPALGPLGRATAQRLVRRARASWPTWVAGAVLLAGGLTLARARAVPSYEVTTVLRIVEGPVDGPALSEAEIHAQVDELAFGNDRLVVLMRKHVASFPKVLTGEVVALDDLRARMTVTVSKDDLLEDRQAGDRRRSARVTVAFRGADPQVTWEVTHELANLLSQSALRFDVINPGRLPPQLDRRAYLGESFVGALLLALILLALLAGASDGRVLDD
jgi:hypothetical protein